MVQIEQGVKILFGSFHRDTDWRVVFIFREIWLTENQWNRALLTWQKENKISPGSPAVAIAMRIAPKNGQGQLSTFNKRQLTYLIKSRDLHVLYRVNVFSQDAHFH